MSLSKVLVTFIFVSCLMRWRAKATDKLPNIIVMLMDDVCSCEF
jgi:hypothetical protein